MAAGSMDVTREVPAITCRSSLRSSSQRSRIEALSAATFFKLAQHQRLDQVFGGVDGKGADDDEGDEGEHQEQKHQLGFPG